MRRISYAVSLLLLSGILLCGCQSKAQEDMDTKIRDLEFTVATEDNIPQELKQNLETAKAQEFKTTYMDKNYLYICAGYGEQKSGGYSIRVKELYLTKNAIYIDTELCGPTPEEASRQVSSYPYIVIKTELIDRNVVFE
ncbi:MAG: protease complex subunit PrcB family protein [Lachnospiraceae bacterium]